MVEIFLNNILTYILCVACVQLAISFHFREGDQSHIHVAPFPPQTGGKLTWIKGIYVDSLTVELPSSPNIKLNIHYYSSYIQASKYAVNISLSCLNNVVYLVIPFLYSDTSRSVYSLCKYHLKRARGLIARLRARGG